MGRFDRGNSGSLAWRSTLEECSHGYGQRRLTVAQVPIPLDWDREWQKWPVTIVTGSYLGWFVFRFAGEYLLRGKRIKFD